MGDTDENSDSDNSRLNQTIAPTRTKADRDKRRAKNFSEEVLTTKSMMEQSTSDVPTSQPSRPGIAVTNIAPSGATSVRVTTSNIQGTSTGFGEQTIMDVVPNSGDQMGLNRQYLNNNFTHLQESNFSPPVASTVVDTGSSVNIVMMMNSKLDQMELANRNTVGIIQAGNDTAVKRNS